jgi:hypothetical protein
VALSLAAASCSGAGGDSQGLYGGAGGAGGTGTQDGGAGTDTASPSDAADSATEGGTAGSDGAKPDTGATSYSIGGAVSGLMGSGLVLRDNGADDLAVAADGPFTFATKLANGASYQVTVATQPSNPSQFCAVASASGTVKGADVTNVTVTCTSGSFSVGGWVAGLKGSGLVLQNNKADDLAIAADGMFAFPTKLASGTTYEVTVLKQPAAPEQTCAVTSGTGTITTADVADVQVACSLKDTDGDKIPDLSDPFPNDPSKPGVAPSNKVYAETASLLFTMDVTTLAIQQVGQFHGQGFSGQVTDIALDEYGVLYAITFTNLFVCNAINAECWKLAGLPQSFNGMTLVPRGTLDPVQDALVGIAESGDWYRIKLTGPQQAQLTLIGSYGGGYTSSGDAFSIAGVGTFASVKKSGSSSDIIVSVDPKTGKVLAEVGPTTGYDSVYGLAGWQGSIFAFDSSGAVLKIDPTNGTMKVITKTNNAWWGAGVVTRM